MRLFSLVVFAVAILWSGGSPAVAAEYEAAVLEEGPPKDKLSPEIAETLQDQGVAVKRGSRTIAEIWLRKKWPIQAGFQPTFQLLYPFKEGELMGVIRYPRDGNDLRDQEIASGVYTLRYGLQPVDGNHVGTSPTRDFVLLLPAEQDKSVAPIGTDALVEHSTEVSFTSHPAILGLQPAQDPSGELPAMRYHEANDWWILQFVGQGEADGKAQDVRVDLVVVGVALE
jgi:hypothetical protein